MSRHLGLMAYGCEAEVCSSLFLAEKSWIPITEPTMLWVAPGWRPPPYPQALACVLPSCRSRNRRNASAAPRSAVPRLRTRLAGSATARRRAGARPPPLRLLPCAPLDVGREDRFPLGTRLREDRARVVNAARARSPFPDTPVAVTWDPRLKTARSTARAPPLLLLPPPLRSPRQSRCAHTVGGPPRVFNACGERCSMMHERRASDVDLHTVRGVGSGMMHLHLHWKLTVLAPRRGPLPATLCRTVPSVSEFRLSRKHKRCVWTVDESRPREAVHAIRAERRERTSWG